MVVEVDYDDALNGLFCAVEDLFYVMENIAGTDASLEAALSRPMASLLAAYQEEDDSDDQAGDLIAAAWRMVDAVTGYRRSAPAPPELAAAVDLLTEELTLISNG